MGFPFAVDFEAVSIHAPLARSNTDDGKTATEVTVSIHAPLARSNFLPPRVPP